MVDSFLNSHVFPLTGISKTKNIHFFLKTPLQEVLVHWYNDKGGGGFFETLLLIAAYYGTWKGGILVLARMVGFLRELVADTY